MPNANAVRPDQPLLSSVLDRLLGEDAGTKTDARASGATYLTDLQAGLRRDIEALLNTHQYCKNLPRELTELPLSLLEYGVPQFLGLSAASPEAREQFRASVEALLRRFEPRLEKLRVTLLEKTDSRDRTLRFRIDAHMRVDPEPEPVSFNSVLESAVRRFSVTTVVA
jgi:type VI secretion system protein ImpF